MLIFLSSIFFLVYFSGFRVNVIYFSDWPGSLPVMKLMTAMRN